jgi:hypothetical protein
LKLLFSILAMIICCSSQAQRNSRDVQEDLAAIRPQFTADSAVISNSTRQEVAYVPPVHTVNAKVDAVLDSIDKLNVIRKFISGYTIQIYSGQSKEDANNAKKKLTDLLDMKADLQYVQPKFRVKVGAYFTSLDAQKDLVLLRRFFPNAILVPETIPIK